MEQWPDRRAHQSAEISEANDVWKGRLRVTTSPHPARRIGDPIPTRRKGAISTPSHELRESQENRAPQSHLTVQIITSPSKSAEAALLPSLEKQTELTQFSWPPSVPTSCTGSGPGPR